MIRDKKWKTLEEKDVSPSKWLSVKQYKVELPSGEVIDDFFISFLGVAAMVCAITKDNEIIFAKQYKHAQGEVLIELPAGLQQKGKSIEETAVAEIKEEIGASIDLDSLIPLGPIISSSTKVYHRVFGFLAKDVVIDSEQNLEVTEDIEVLKIKPKKVLEMIESGEIWVSDTISFIMRVYLKFPEIFE